MEKILVTGSSGFIGMHLCRNLLDDGYNVYGIDNMNDYYDVSLKEARLSVLSDYDNFTFNKIDISNLRDVERVFKQFKPKIVVNFILGFLFIILTLITLTLNIFSIFFFKFFLFDLLGTLKTILFCSDKFVDFSVTIGEIILSYKYIFSILQIPFF